MCVYYAHRIIVHRDQFRLEEFRKEKKNSDEVKINYRQPFHVKSYTFCRGFATLVWKFAWKFGLMKAKFFSMGWPTVSYSFRPMWATPLQKVNDFIWNGCNCYSNTKFFQWQIHLMRKWNEKKKVRKKDFCFSIVLLFGL